MSTHFNQKQRRKAEFIKPDNLLKQKVGSGGLSNDILEKAQTLLENNTVDFEPLCNIYLSTLQQGVETAKSFSSDDDLEHVLSRIIYPAMQLKANGGMFHYHLITSIADKLIQFLEVLNELDDGAIEIITAFHTSMRAVIQGKIKGDSGQHGKDLLMALEKACLRYFNKHPNLDFV